MMIIRRRVMCSSIIHILAVDLIRVSVAQALKRGSRTTFLLRYICMHFSLVFLVAVKNHSAWRSASGKKEWDGDDDHHEERREGEDMILSSFFWCENFFFASHAQFFPPKRKSLKLLPLHHVCIPPSSVSEASWKLIIPSPLNVYRWCLCWKGRTCCREKETGKSLKHFLRLFFSWNRMIYSLESGDDRQRERGEWVAQVAQSFMCESLVSVRWSLESIRKGLW